MLQPMPSFLQEQINISLDHRCRIFQNLDGALGEQWHWEGVEPERRKGGRILEGRRGGA